MFDLQPPRHISTLRKGTTIPVAVREVMSSFGTVEDFLQVLTSALTVIARGEITPAEGAQIAERVDARYARAAPRTVDAPVDALAGHSNESGPDRSIP